MSISTAVLVPLFLCALVAGQPTESTPLACNSNGIPKAQRQHYRNLTQRLRASVREKSGLADGYRIRIDGTSFGLSTAAEWITMERLCCPFLNFQLEVNGKHKDWWLSLTGPEGVKDFLDAEFALSAR